MPVRPAGFLEGLTPEEVLLSRQTYGSNRLYIRPKRGFIHMLWEVLRDPMFLLLLVGCSLYFALGDHTEAWIMAVSVLFVFALEVIQEYRSEGALKALRQMAQPKVRVVRSGSRQEILTEEVVVGDLLVFEEGERLAADGKIVHAMDLSLDESVLTGESLPVEKEPEAGKDAVFQGATVSSGMGIARVTAVGNATVFGKLGKAIEQIDAEPTPFQRKISRFVRQMLIAGFAAFLLVLGINFSYEGNWMSAVLFSLAFALALIPEEIPVAFSAFLAIGAFRMSRQGVLVKQPKTVESLGSATVLCLDKTGTITENRMSVAEVRDFSGKNRVLEYAMWASEPDPFDAMEKAIHEAYSNVQGMIALKDYRLIHDYPLGGIPPMMTHIYQNDSGVQFVASKGAVERILQVCNLDETVREIAMRHTIGLASKGYRILGVASAVWESKTYPDRQDDFAWEFEGLVALYDPPKPNIREVMDRFYQIGLKVKMVTGDYAQTALNIATESGIRHSGAVLTGEDVMQMGEDELSRRVGETAVFARMFPDAKLRLVEALKSVGEVVAMTGDGVNDGPALKAAQIGIAMGRKGTEIAKGAASMVLLDDNLEHLVAAVINGRKIYQNLKKAIRYVISIHVPIVLTVLLPLLFNWPYLHILLPIHVVFLELIMDPTCVIAYENEPAEKRLLNRPPGHADGGLFTWKQLAWSILQGLVLTAGIMFMYHYTVARQGGEEEVRGSVFLTLMFSNIFLTLVNRSFRYSILKTIRYRNLSLWYILIATLGVALAIYFIPILSDLFKLAFITPSDFFLCALVALICAGWPELWKGFLEWKKR